MTKKEKKMIVKKINTETVDGDPATMDDVRQVVNEVGAESQVKKSRKKIKKEVESQDNDGFEPVKEYKQFFTEFEKKRSRDKFKRDTFERVIDPTGTRTTRTGRPSKYFRELPALMYEYFTDAHWNIVINTREMGKEGQQFLYSMKAGILPTFEGFGTVVGISTKSMLEYYNKKVYDKDGKFVGYFSDKFRKTYDACNQIQKEFIQRATTIGLMKENRSKFLLSANHNMNEKQELINTDSDTMKKTEQKLEAYEKLSDDQLQKEIDDMFEEN